MMPDQRIVYGVRCSWWGSIVEVSAKASGLPCCPHCGGVLLEVANETTWWRDVDRYEANGHPGYRAFLGWLRGKCRPTVADARAEYDAATLRQEEATQ